MFKKFFILILFFLYCKTYTVLPEKAQVHNIQEGILYLQEWIQSTIEENKIVGLSLVVVDNQSVIWKYIYGYEDLKNRVLLSEKSNFQIGSIAKIINAIAILKLIQEKKLKFEDPIHKYLKYLPGNYDYNNPITIRQLVIHHSGLPSDLFRYLWNDSPISLSEIEEKLKDIYLSYKPGEVFSYSNLAVTISGRIIEIVSKKDYHNFIKEICNELEMDNTFTNFHQVQNFVKSYHVNMWGNYELKEPPIALIPAGGMYSNIQDMAKLMQILLNHGYYKNKKILDSSYIKEMFSMQNQNAKYDDEFRIGFPFFLTNLGFGFTTQASHGGDTVGYHSMMILLPDLPLGIIVMTNTTTGARVVSDIALQTISFFAKYKHNIIREPITKLNLKNLIYKQDNLLGYYNTTSGILKIYKWDKEEFYCEFLNYKCILKRENLFYRLYIKILNLFTIEIFPENKLLFKQVDDTIIVYLVSGDSTIPYGSKIKDFVYVTKNSAYKKNPEYWTNKTGEYYNIDKGNEFLFIEKLQFFKKENLFFVSLYWNTNKIPITYIVEPINENLLRISGYGRNLGDILILKDNQIEYSGYTFIKK